MASMDMTRKFAGDRKEDIESGRWIKTQQRIFTRWANAYLKTRKLKISDVFTDLADGVMLINLLEILGKEPVKKKWKKVPKMRIHKLENLKVAFDYMRESDLVLSNVGTTDVIDGNEKIILGLLWNIIAKFQVGEISLDGVSGKEGLLLWVQRTLQGYESVKVKDFSKSWKDGMAFCAMLHKYRPDLIEFESLSPDNASDNLALAFKIAEDYFGIDRILDVEDIIDAIRPDEKIVITYVAFCFKGIADYLRRLNLAKSIGKAVDITKRHDAWIAEYQTEASELSQWMAATTEQFSQTYYGNTAAQIKESLDAFNAYKQNVKPGYKGKRGRLEGLYNTFVSSCRNNNRPIFEPADGLKESDLQNNWKVLEETENKYEADVRTQYALFLRLENTIAMFNAKVKKASTWLDTQNETFCNGNYGDSLTAAETLIASYESYESQLEHFRGLVATLEGWSTDGGIDQHAQHGEMVEALTALKAKVEEVVGNGTLYSQYLAMARERFEKFDIMDKVQAWGVQQVEFFNKEQYGASLLETNALIESHTNNWPVQVGAKKEILEGMSSEQEEILERLTAEKASLAAVEESADTYNAWLLCMQERYEKFDAMDRVHAWMDGHNATFAGGEYGSDLTSVNALIAAYNETYVATLPSKQELLNTMESNQEEITARVAQEQEALAATEAAAAAYLEQLNLSLERANKLPELDRIEAWLASQNEVFQAGDYGDSLVAVATRVEIHANFESQIAVHIARIAALESGQDVINGRRAEVEASVASTQEMGAQHAANLEQSRAYYENLVQLNKEYNKKADDFIFLVDDVEDALNEPLLTTSLEDLQSAKTRFEGEVKSMMDRATEAYNEMDGIARQLIEAGVDSAFSRFTLEDLYNKYLAVFNQMESRAETINNEIAAETARDDMRKEFATHAAELRAYVDAKTAEVGGLAGTLEEQLETLNNMKTEYRESARLAQIDGLAMQLADAGIVDNAHTTETVTSLHAIWEVLQGVFDSASDSVQAAILASRDEKVTPEQLKEMKEVFEFFDQDGDEALKPSEFHSCCTGIGMILTEEELKEQIIELDDDGNGVIDFQEFTGFMMQRLVEPGHTEEDVKAAFADLGDGEEYVPKQVLSRTFINAEHLDYLTTKMPETSVEGEEGPCFPYTEFVADLFTR